MELKFKTCTYPTQTRETKRYTHIHAPLIVVLKNK